MSATKTVYQVVEFKSRAAISGHFASRRAALVAAPRCAARGQAWAVVPVRVPAGLVRVFVKTEKGEKKMEEQKKNQGLDLVRCESITDDGWVSVEQSRGCARAYVARITGKDQKFGFAREFVRCHDDQTGRSGRGNKNYAVKHLADGIYEAKSTWRSLDSHTTYFQVIGGSVAQILSKDKVLDLI